ncbi:MAG: hypothetical protein JSS53_04220 [Proteobacteria bacterium]|nr:hypothetical protein [Pseudomonadota bacterium]
MPRFIDNAIAVLLRQAITSAASSRAQILTIQSSPVISTLFASHLLPFLKLLKKSNSNSLLEEIIESYDTLRNTPPSVTAQFSIAVDTHREKLRLFYLQLLFSLISHYQLAADFAANFSASPLSKKLVKTNQQLWASLIKHFKDLGSTQPPTLSDLLDEILNPALLKSDLIPHLHYEFLLRKMIIFLQYSKLFITDTYHKSLDSLIQALQGLIRALPTSLNVVKSIQDTFTDICRIFSSKIQALGTSPPAYKNLVEWQDTFFYLNMFQDLLSQLIIQFKPILPSFNAHETSLETERDNYKKTTFVFFRAFVFSQLPNDRGWFTSWTKENTWLFGEVLQARNSVRDQMQIGGHSTGIQFPNWSTIIQQLLLTRDKTYFHSSIWLACQNTALVIIRNQLRSKCPIENKNPIGSYTQLIQTLAHVLKHDFLLITSTQIIKKLVSRAIFHTLPPEEKIWVLYLIQYAQTKHEVLHPIIYNLFLHCLNLEKDSEGLLVPIKNPKILPIDINAEFAIDPNNTNIQISLKELITRHNRFIKSRQSVLHPTKNQEEAKLLLDDLVEPSPASSTALIPAPSSTNTTRDLYPYVREIADELDVFYGKFSKDNTEYTNFQTKVAILEKNLADLSAQLSPVELSTLKSLIDKYRFSEAINHKLNKVRQNPFTKEVFESITLMLDQLLQAARIMNTDSFQVRGNMALELTRGAIHAGSTLIPLSVVAQVARLVGDAARMVGEYKTEFSMKELSNFTLTGNESSLFAQNITAEIIFYAFCQNKNMLLDPSESKRFSNALFARLLSVIRQNIADEDRQKTLDALVEKYFYYVTESDSQNSIFKLADNNASPNTVDLNNLLINARNARQGTAKQTSMSYTDGPGKTTTELVRAMNTLYVGQKTILEHSEQQTDTVMGLSQEVKLLKEQNAELFSALKFLFERTRDLEQQITHSRSTPREIGYTEQPLALPLASSARPTNITNSLISTSTPIQTRDSSTLVVSPTPVRPPEHVLILRELAGKEIVMARDINRLIQAIETITTEDLKVSQGNRESGSLKILHAFIISCSDDLVEALPNNLKNIVCTFRDNIKVVFDQEKKSGLYTQTFTLTHLFCSEIIKSMLWTKIDGKQTKIPTDKTELILFKIREFCFDETIIKTRQHAVTLVTASAYRAWNEANQALYDCFPKVSIPDRIQPKDIFGFINSALSAEMTSDNFAVCIENLVKAFTSETILLKWIEAFTKIKQCYQFIASYVKGSDAFVKQLGNPDTFVGLPILKELFNIHNLLSKLVENTSSLDENIQKNLATIHLVIKGLLDNHQSYAYLGDPSNIHLIRTNSDRQAVALKFVKDILFFQQPVQALSPIKPESNTEAPAHLKIQDRKLQKRKEDYEKLRNSLTN